MAAPIIESSMDIAEAGQTFDVNLPSGTVAGNLLLAIIAKDDDPAMYSSHGFTNAYSIIGGDHGTWGWWKIADADDITRGFVTFTGDNEGYVGRMYRITGFDSGTPIDIVDTTGATGTSNTPQAPAVETVTDDALVFATTGMDDNDEPYTLETGGWVIDLNTSVTTAGIVIGRKVMSTKGVTGAVDYTTNASDGWAATQVAIRPGGTAYNKTFDDDIGVTDPSQPIEVKTIVRTESESLGVMDASQPAVLKTFERTESESLGLTDARERVSTYVRTVNDPLGITDEMLGVPSVAQQWQINVKIG